MKCYSELMDMVIIDLEKTNMEALDRRPPN
jgi:hypothetical protein